MCGFRFPSSPPFCIELASKRLFLIPGLLFFSHQLTDALKKEYEMADKEKNQKNEDQCANSCHDAWQECREKKPEDPSACNTRLAHCVKDCTTKEK